VPCGINTLRATPSLESVNGDLSECLQTGGWVPHGLSTVFVTHDVRHPLTAPKTILPRMVRFFTESLPRHLPRMMAIDAALLTRPFHGTSLGFFLAVGIANTVLPLETTASLLKMVYDHCDGMPSVLPLFATTHSSYKLLQTLEWHRSLRATWITACVRGGKAWGEEGEKKRMKIAL
jgi:hypothetical protein